MGLMYIGGYLKTKGLMVKIIDSPMKKVVRNKRFYKNIEVLVDEIKEDMLNQLVGISTEYIGISCYSDEYREVKELIKDIRDMKDNYKIIVGGVHPTLKPDDFNGIADTIVRGEGEVAVFDIINKNIKGVVDAKINDIDRISFPDYSLVDMEYYTNANPYAIRGVQLRSAYLLASRGCPSQCTFCVAPRLRPYTGVNRFRNPFNIIFEIEELKKNYAIDGFYFIDDMFICDKEKVLAFCHLLREKKLNLLWGCSAKINYINEEMIESMSRSGCIQIDFGVERGSNTELARLSKFQTIEKVKKAFSVCDKYSIRTFANFLVNIPGEKMSDYTDIEHLIEDIRPTVVSVNTYRGYLGTELPHKEAEKWIIKWAELTNYRYNNIIKTIKFHFSGRYWKVILKSRRKLNYIKQLWVAVKELINIKL